MQTFTAGLVINSLSFVPTDGCWVHGFRNDPDALYRLAQARLAECSAELCVVHPLVELSSIGLQIEGLALYIDDKWDVNTSSLVGSVQPYAHHLSVAVSCYC